MSLIRPSCSDTGESLVAARIGALVAAKQLVSQAAGTAGAALIQLPHNDRAERKIAEVVLRLRRGPSGLPPIKAEAAVEWAEKRAGFVFDALQRDAVRHALANKVTVLTGGPGTGKTTCLRALVDILKAKKVRVHLAAPTGRAAQRLAETTGGFASTIHRLLKYDHARGGFTANEDHPLATDFLIVDEASMLDVRLAAALFQAVPLRAHLLLVGDVDQLPSVGAGNVLKDLIAASGAPVTRLAVDLPPEGPERDRDHRARDQQRRCVAPAGRSRRRRRAPGATWRSFRPNSAEDCLRKVVELCTQFVPRHYPGFTRSTTCRCWRPMHKGVAGVANLNAELQAALTLEPAAQAGADAEGSVRAPRALRRGVPRATR